MLIQVIHCHPLIDSYNHTLFQTITTGLEDNGHQVVATDPLPRTVQSGDEHQ
jgi:hypothetical protein